MNNIVFETWDLPILYPLVAIYKLFESFGIPHPLTFSIVILTILIRFLLYPLITSQLKSTQKMQKLSPELARVKEIHKGDAKMIQQETMKLYKEHGINPAAGCLPLLIQLPVIFILYSVLLDLVKSPQLVTQKINEVVTIDVLKLSEPINQSFFFFPLGKSPAELFSGFGLLIFLVPLITGVLQFIQSKMMFPTKKGVEVKKDDFASIFQTQTVYIFPIMIAVFSYTLPIGLSLYWNVFTLFGIIQQYRITGLGGIAEYLNKNGGK